jgi:hypothetical protein
MLFFLNGSMQAVMTPLWTPSAWLLPSRWLLPADAIDATATLETNTASGITTCFADDPPMVHASLPTQKRAIHSPDLCSAEAAPGARFVPTSTQRRPLPASSLCVML